MGWLDGVASGFSCGSSEGHFNHWIWPELDRGVEQGF